MDQLLQSPEPPSEPPVVNGSQPLWTTAGNQPDHRSTIVKPPVNDSQRQVNVGSGLGQVATWQPVIGPRGNWVLDDDQMDLNMKKRSKSKMARYHII
uniref:Uncharacterized protein n=1 Tax=Tanacetum cinerariifolium TaxID=118510 RepID=A0A6L2M3E7_TANCI|nr:hypothetical protein [Tanacetum cinerariifolium]